MRNKIIAVNAVIVTLVGLLSFALVRAALMSAVGNTEQLLAEAKREAQGAAGRLQLGALRAERWIAAQAAESQTGDRLLKAIPSARQEAARATCDAVLSAAKAAPAFEGTLPSLAVLVDRGGKIVGRNGSDLSQGDDLGVAYPGLKLALERGQTGSEVWANAARNDQYLASFAPVRDDRGRVVGALAIAVALNDVLSRVGDAVTGRGVVLAVPAGDSWQVVARSTRTQPALVDAVIGKARDALRNALASGHAIAVPSGDVITAATPLEDLDQGKRVVLVVAAPTSLVDNPTGLLSPIFGVTALGLGLVVLGGLALGNYITRPINMLEEGLLAILNGQSDRRFELDHAELGGLAFRIDQLLNQLMGVEEDTTDDEGRPSKAPTAADFKDAMAVDERRAEGAEARVDPGTVQHLSIEPATSYYARIYREYIAAKKALGEQVDHVTEEAFVSRIQSMEQDAAQKYGKPVRYEVKATGREVVLLAVPLS